MSGQATAKKKPKAGRGEKRASHTVAELVTLTFSALLILTVAGYLAYEATQANEPFVPVQIELRIEETRAVDGRFILPMHIVNRGGQTLRDLKIEVRTGAQPGAARPAEIIIDYLGEGSEQIAFVYFDVHPRGFQAEARAISYRVE